MNKYLLHINEPCTENWDSMPTAEQGKFCSHCNKTVFDFTSATDAEIIKHIEAMKGQLFCGRVEENQLDRWIKRSDIKTSNPRLYKFLISFMLLGAVQGASAQASPAQEKVSTQRRLDSLLNLEGVKAEIGGQVCDSMKERSLTKSVDEKVITVGAVRTTSVTEKAFIIIDGQVLKKGNITELDPKKIINIVVMNPNKSQELFGPQVSNGIVVITSTYTKKQLRKLL